MHAPSVDNAHFDQMMQQAATVVPLDPSLDGQEEDLKEQFVAVYFTPQSEEALIERNSTFFENAFRIVKCPVSKEQMFFHGPENIHNSFSDENIAFKVTEIEEQTVRRNSVIIIITVKGQCLYKANTHDFESQLIMMCQEEEGLSSYLIMVDNTTIHPNTQPQAISQKNKQFVFQNKRLNNNKVSPATQHQTKRPVAVVPVHVEQPSVVEHSITHEDSVSVVSERPKTVVLSAEKTFVQSPAAVQTEAPVVSQPQQPIEPVVNHVNTIRPRLNTQSSRIVRDSHNQPNKNLMKVLDNKAQDESPVADEQTQPPQNKKFSGSRGPRGDAPRRQNGPRGQSNNGDRFDGHERPAQELDMTALYIPRLPDNINETQLREELGEFAGNSVKVRMSNFNGRQTYYAHIYYDSEEHCAKAMGHFQENSFQIRGLPVAPQQKNKYPRSQTRNFPRNDRPSFRSNQPRDGDNEMRPSRNGNGGASVSLPRNNKQNAPANDDIKRDIAETAGWN